MKQTNLYLFLLLLCIPILFIADILFGSVSIPFHVFTDYISGTTIDEVWHNVIFEIRLPRAIVAIITGISLPIAGLLMQTLFRNPLADPYILGISTGASLGVALFSLAGGYSSAYLLSQIGFSGNWGLVISAFLGSGIVMVIMVSIAPKVFDTASLLIIGIMLGSITSAVVSVLQYYANPEEVHTFILWTFGSFSNVSWNEILILLMCIVPAIALAFSIHKPLNALLLGENYARGLGVSIKRLRLFVILSASILASVITAFTGPIGFIGMTVPHLARFIFKTTNHKNLLIYSSLLGANLLLLCDVISQMPGFETTLPINTVTAIFGAPIVIMVIYKGRKSSLQY